MIQQGMNQIFSSLSSGIMQIGAAKFAKEEREERTARRQREAEIKEAEETRAQAAEARAQEEHFEKMETMRAERAFEEQRRKEEAKTHMGEQEERRRRMRYEQSEEERRREEHAQATEEREIKLEQLRHPPQYVMANLRDRAMPMLEQGQNWQQTKEIIKEFPPDKTLDMIARVWEMAGLMVDEKR